MPENADPHWDEPYNDSDADDAPLFIDDDPFLDDTEDSFAVRTFDSGALTGAHLLADDRGANREPDATGAKPATQTPAPAMPIPLRRAAGQSAREPRSTSPPSAWWVTLRTLLIVGAAAVLVSTLFSLWTRPDFFTDEFRAGLNQVQATQRVINIQPSPLPTETRAVRIGVIAGHSGKPRDDSFDLDPGAVCPDGLTELEINQAVARDVVAALRRLEYEVDLLDEFDEQLIGYQADVLVSIHTNDCQNYGEGGTGFNAASASGRQTTRGEDEYLLACLIDQYSKTTGLPQHFGLTYDMTDYHTFGEVSADTPTAIIELGFMNKDRLMLTTQRTLLAQGIVNGILCFLQPDLYAE
jgi:N-acetylmuramoyl-L-alanine amidase